MSSPAALAVDSILSRGPIRIGTMSRRFAASMAPDNADSSHGCATAVGTGFRFLHFANICSYFPVPVWWTTQHLLGRSFGRYSGCGTCFFQEKYKNDCNKNSEQERCKCNLIVLVLHLPSTAGYALKYPSEDWPQKSTESKI